MPSNTNGGGRARLEEMVDRLCGTGALYQSQHGECYFVTGTGAALRLDRMPFAVHAGRFFGLAPTGGMASRLIEALKARAMRSPVVRAIRLSTVVDGTLLVHLGGGQIVALKGGTVERVTNGANGTVLMEEEEEFAPLNLGRFSAGYSAAVSGRSLTALRSALLDHLPPPDPESGLTELEQRVLVLGWWIGIFLGCIAKARPILMLLGPHGSGKTTVQRLIATLFYGEQGDVGGGVSLDRVMKDIAAGSVHRSLVARDDVNDLPPGSADVLCRAATGTTFYVSEFNETLRLGAYRANAAITLSAFRPSWLTREDLNSRLLLITFGRPPESSVTERQRREHVLSIRDAVWGETLALLASLSKPLATREGLTAITRFDDWEIAVRRIFLDWFGEDTAFTRALVKMDAERRRTMRRANALMDLLASLAEDPNVNTREFLAAELADLIQTKFGVLANGRDPHLARSLASDPQRLGQFLDRVERDGTPLFAVHRRGGHDHKCIWALTPRGARAPWDVPTTNRPVEP